MQKNYNRLAGKLILFSVFVLTATIGKAQSVYLPQSYQFYQKFNADIYSKSSSMHTSLRPFLIDSAISNRYNQLMQMGVDSNRHNWFLRKIFNEHLIEVNKKDYTFYADYLQDNTIGHDFSDHSNTEVHFKPLGFGFTTRIGTNTRGFQFGGTVGSKFSFYTSGYENQAAFPQYYTDYVKQIGFVPGQAYDRGKTKTYRDYSYATAILSYTPIKQINITLGQDKTFIGDGYRSILLSDYSANYPLLRVTANVGKVQYMMMWTYLQDQNLVKFDSFGNNRRKWGLFHYLDWNVNNSLSFGFFNAYIAPEADDQGNRRGFDVNFVNPVIFASGLGPSSQPGNALVGFTGKYKVFDKSAIYGQLLFDRFNGKNYFQTDNVDNSGGVQLGIRGADIFGVQNLNYLLEYDAVKPYTYSNRQVISAYSYYSQPLGDPLGANFRELVGIMNYTYKRFDFQGQLMYAKYGLDLNAADNAGRDVTKPLIPTYASNKVGQGLNTNLYYAEGTVAFLLNPKYNLRFELGALYRHETNSLGTKNASVLTFGIKSSFRNLYHDF
ncbi:gliding motility protein RemB [Mucilaginibacter sp. MD40]|uniref:gliding motility protein RemB n=1 Tax=Mucilaginibacter sp. MD40 TaxID=2029590 RepID=UPI001E28EDCA|nr:gliding motility protein RemB [Mucilaginibacter sp. MD40]